MKWNKYLYQKKQFFNKMFKEGINCINHKDSKFLFYCFDDKSYLCEECFREHKSHNLEIKSDIKKFQFSLCPKMGSYFILIIKIILFIQEKEHNYKEQE